MNLATVLGDSKNLLALGPEDLAGVILEIIQQGLASKILHVGKGDQFNKHFLIGPLQALKGNPDWPADLGNDVEQAFAEAFAWLESRVLIVRYNCTNYYSLSRRGRLLQNRIDLQAYREASILPAELVHHRLVAKVVPLFVRGDHEIAVVQAFKEVEVAVRQAAKYGSEQFGVSMMKSAFHVENGPLTNRELVPAEREADLFLFAGAIGHAKNPGSHRHVEMSRIQAARLILFASHLLDITVLRGLGNRTFSG